MNDCKYLCSVLFIYVNAFLNQISLKGTKKYILICYETNLDIYFAIKQLNTRL